VGAIVLFAPLAEEGLFRGLLFGGLVNAFGFWPAALVSGAVFGAAHLDLSLWVGLSVAGVWLDWLYWRYRSLWVSTVAHATLNGLSVLLAMTAR
jgi:membrane protease YdiL (CAAX protease family)